jgi:hypothetical protein
VQKEYRTYSYNRFRLTSFYATHNSAQMKVNFCLLTENKALYVDRGGKFSCLPMYVVYGCNAKFDARAFRSKILKKVDFVNRFVRRNDDRVCLKIYNSMHYILKTSKLLTHSVFYFTCFDGGHHHHQGIHPAN